MGKVRPRLSAVPPAVGTEERVEVLARKLAYDGVVALVTGVDGFIGLRLAEALVGAGAKVTALAQYNSFYCHGWLDDLTADTVSAMDLVRGDVGDPAFMMGLAEGQDVVFHLAALIAIPHSYAAPQSYIDTNVTGTFNVLKAARQGCCGRVEAGAVRAPQAGYTT